MNRHCNRAVFRMGMGAMALVWLGAAAARGDLVTFELDPTVPVPNGFVSVESTHVSFTDTVGAQLDVANVPPETIGNGLRVFDDGDGGFLEMNFDCLVTDLSLSFGNDDPGWTVPGDVALLRTYLGATPVGQFIVLLNRDDINNQTISSGPSLFNRATFAYTNANLVPFTGGGAAAIGLIEVVDNVQFTCIPEPAAVTLGVCGLMGIWARTRIRRRAR